MTLLEATPSIKKLQNKYLYLNNNFPRTCVYRIGSESGFFSEYNNLLLFALNCYIDKISLKINSKYANFKFKQGWKDYFFPSLEEYESPINLINTRYHTFKKVKNPIASSFKSFLVETHKKIYNIDYFTQDLWTKYRNNRNDYNRKFNFPEFDFKGNLVEALNLINSFIFKPNEKVIQHIENLITDIGLPEKYIAFHIRQGDKAHEYQLYEVEKYFDAEVSNYQLKNAFIYTDDISIIEKIKQSYPQWNFFYDKSLITGGYDHKMFQSMPKDIKYNLQISLIANSIILSRGVKFVGTSSSNIGIFVGIMKKNMNCKFIDYEQWVFC